MKKTSLGVILLSVSLSIIGCATAPFTPASRPWVRSLTSAHVIDPHKKITVEVTGVTSPLLGKEQLLSETLQLSLSNLLMRRGFTIDNAAYDYSVKLSYRTDRNSKMRLSSDIYSNNPPFNEPETASNLGVSVAQTVSMLALHSAAITVRTPEQTVFYTHTISIELSNKKGDVLWESDTTWDSNELDVTHHIIPTLQIMLSSLPSDQSFRPEIPEIKDSHVGNYYRLACKDVWFTCPALPDRILFEHSYINITSSTFHNGTAIPNNVKNQNALAAYVDLLNTAEYALPNAHEKQWKDPLDISLWSQVTLGGQYYLGPAKTPVNIIIELSRQLDSYYIDECKAVSDDEYAVFNNKLTTWRKTLHNFFDLYK